MSNIYTDFKGSLGVDGKKPIEVFIATDIGSTRAVNQDSLCYVNFDYKGTMCVLAFVFDGMGGHSYGEEISRMAKEIVVSTLNSEFDTLESLARTIEKQLRYANELIYAKYYGKGGTTAVGYLDCGDMIYWWNIGDSRLYFYDINQDQLTQVTTDHTLMQHELDMGVITAEDIPNYNKKNALINAMGIERDVDVSSGFIHNVNGRNALLLCSDGFYHNLNKTMVSDLTHHVIDFKQVVEHLIRLGETDNISAILQIQNN